MASRDSLEGKVAVITGGSRGIGFAMAREFAVHGCQVIISARDGKSLSSATASLRQGKGEVVGLPCDVTDAERVQELFAEVKRRHSKLDILINNAGLAQELAPVERLSIATWKLLIDTNLNAMFFCTRAALPLMSAGGTIVNNLSVAAVRPFAGLAAYNASKSGALGFTNVLREELRQRGIRVLALIVGATDTDIWNQFWPDAPRDKMISPSAVAGAVFHAVTLPTNTTIEEIRLGPTLGAL